MPRGRRSLRRRADEIGIAGQGMTRPNAHQIHPGLGVERIEIVEVGDVRQDRDGNLDPCLRLGGACCVERERIFRRQQPGVRKERHKAERPPSGHASDRRHAVGEQRGIPRNLLTRKPRIIAASEGSITALVPTRLAITPPRSISHEDDRHVRRAREPHIGDIIGAQIDLRSAAGAFDQYEIASRPSRP